MVRDQCDSPLRGASAPRGPGSTLLDRHQHSGRKRAAAANVASGALRATDGKPHEHPSAAAALGAPHGRAESRPGHGPGGRCTHLPDMRFPAPSSSSQSSTFPAASHRSDKVEPGNVTIERKGTGRDAAVHGFEDELRVCAYCLYSSASLVRDAPGWTMSRYRNRTCSPGASVRLPFCVLSLRKSLTPNGLIECSPYPRECQ